MGESKVIIYTQPGCSACGSAKDYLSKKGVAFEDKNVIENETAFKELTQKYNSRSTPTIVVDGEVVIGFDRERLEKLLS